MKELEFLDLDTIGCGWMRGQSPGPIPGFHDLDVWVDQPHLGEQTLLEESEEIHSDLEAMTEKIQSLTSVYCTERMSQQVAELGRETEELRQMIKIRLQNLQDAAKDMKKFEAELKNLQAALEQAQTTLTSPEVGRLTLKEQLSHRQHLLSEMESLKPKVQAVQLCQSALRIPEDVVTSLPLCHAALRLQEEASRLQHTAIQQYNIMQAGVAAPPLAEQSRMSHGLLFLALCGLSQQNTSRVLNWTDPCGYVK
ncbi:PREDICTED: nesprin-1-like [Galeopterus variegatus]|uniref:Nesprin-1-like n=1 Tax=Galeopterus variegatus TaxID=482537 RepID=A0ABM0PYW2_GALVR|nr:PREDICTED: nesprin-1-like [Galeopterus variegatus]